MKESEIDLIHNLQAQQDVAKFTQIMQDTTKSAEIRGAASEALFNLGALTIETLVEAVLQDNAYAVKPLIRIGKPAVGPLLAVLKNGGYRAAWPLGAIGDNLAVDPLLVALKSENEKSREAAAWALGQIGDVRAVEQLKIATKDESELVRKQAAEALEKIQPVCGFCKQEFVKGTGAPSVKVDLYKTTNQPGLATRSKYINQTYTSVGGSQRITTSGTVYWDDKSIIIPCCKSCELKWKQQKNIYILGSFATGLIFDILAYILQKVLFGSNDSGFWFLAAFILVIWVVTGYLIGLGKIKELARQTPNVKSLLNSGWNEGPNPYTDFFTNK